MADLLSRGVGSFQADLDAYHAINAVLRGRAKHSQRQFSINGRSLEEMSISELKELSGVFRTTDKIFQKPTNNQRSRIIEV